jgi:hypothetical protein
VLPDEVESKDGSKDAMKGWAGAVLPGSSTTGGGGGGSSTHLLGTRTRTGTDTCTIKCSTFSSMPEL